MNDAEKNRRASEAERLLNEPLLVEALDEIMGDAFAEFKEMPITTNNLEAVLALQARARSVQELVDRLKAVITASGRHDGGVTIDGEPTE